MQSDGPTARAEQLRSAVESMPLGPSRDRFAALLEELTADAAVPEDPEQPEEQPEAAEVAAPDDVVPFEAAAAQVSDEPESPESWVPEHWSRAGDVGGAGRSEPEPFTFPTGAPAAPPPVHDTPRRWGRRKRSR